MFYYFKSLFLLLFFDGEGGGSRFIYGILHAPVRLLNYRYLTISMSKHFILYYDTQDIIL